MKIRRYGSAVAAFSGYQAHRAATLAQWMITPQRAESARRINGYYVAWTRLWGSHQTTLWCASIADRDSQILRSRPLDEPGRMSSADVQFSHRMPDVVDRPHVHRRASPVTAVSAGRVETDRHDINRNDGRFVGSIGEDGAQFRLNAVAGLPLPLPRTGPSQIAKSLRVGSARPSAR